MAQIRIKRSTGSSAPSSSSLANAELAFAEGNDILYYGEGTSGSNAASVIKIGGSGAFVALEGNQTVGGNKTFTGDVALKNLTVTGTTTTVNTTNTKVSDNILELNQGASSNTNDCGIIIERGSTGDNAFIGWDESSDQFILGTTTATADSTGNLSITAGTIQGNVTGSATQLASTRTFSLTGDVTGSQTFNGTGDAAIAATIASGAVEKGMLNLVSGSNSPGLTVKGDGTSSGTSGFLQLNCSYNTHGVKISSPPHSAAASYTLTLPNSITNNGLLKTDSSGNLSWATLAAGSGLSLSGSTFSVANDSITEAMLDVHNSPTDGYILKYSSTNGLIWGAAGAGGENNQNAFSNVAVSGQTTVAADSSTDTVNFAGAGGLSITTNASNDTVTFTIGTLNQNTTGSAATLTTARNIGGVSFDGSADINLPGVNTAGNQNTTGSAATLTTAREIAGVSFDGSANISLNNNAITNGAGYITSSGNAATATTATNVSATANNSTNETVYPTFIDGATGPQGIETDTGLTYNPSTGQLDFAVLDGGSY